MSAYKLNPEKFDALAATLNQATPVTRPNTLGDEVETQLFHHGFALNGTSTVQRFEGLNRTALAIRYGDKMRDTYHQVVPSEPIKDPYILYKLLAELRYQCQEGLATETDAYKELERLIGVVAGVYADRATREYPTSFEAYEQSLSRIGRP